MQIKVLERIPDDPELRRSWNGLALRMERPEVFYTFEWAIAVQRAYESSLAPLIFLAYEAESLVGVAALARRSRGDVAFLTADTGDYCEFLSDPSQRQEFANGVFSGLRDRGISRVVLTNLPADSATAHAISCAASSVRYRLHLRPAYACARVVLGSAEERARLKQSVLARKRIRRNIPALQKSGPVTLQHETKWDEIKPLLPTFRKTQVARFLEAGKISNLIREERRIFLEELAQQLSLSGWIVMSRLLVGEVTAAWNYGFRFAGSWFWYQPTVNHAYAEFSPGYCLLAKMVERACDSWDLNVVDLGLGAEEYKERFATATRQTYYCELNRSLPRHWGSVLRYRAASMAAASPRIESRIRAGISRIADVRKVLSDSGSGSLAMRLIRMARHWLVSFDKLLFFEWPNKPHSPVGGNTRLQPLDSETLGTAAIQYGDDLATLRFLMCCARRLRYGQGQGYVLATAEGIPVHFCWAKDLEGYEMPELNRTLHAPCDDAVLIFDCFTPTSVRGHGFFSEAISMLADQLQRQGRSAWIFRTETHRPSVRGIEKTSFEYRFSLGRKRISFLKRSKDSIPSPAWSNTRVPVPTL